VVRASSGNGDAWARGEMSRLLRLLELIGTQAQASTTVEGTLLVVAEALRADMVCIASAIGQQLVPRAVAGAPIAELTSSWMLGPAARQAVERSIAIRHSAVAEVDRPPGLRHRPRISGAWIPLPADPVPSGDLLILFRGHAEPFSSAEIQILTSVAYRIGTAVERLERATAIERLAAAGPGLARHVDLASMLNEAVVLLRDLTGTDSAFIVIREAEQLKLATYTGVDESIARRWPRTTATMPNWHLLSQGKPYVGPREIIAERPTETDSSPTVLCVPVMRDDTAVALLGATGHRPRSFGKTSMDIATILANYLGAAMTNADLYRTLRQRERELHHRASHDPLTGLANRTQLSQRIDEALADAGQGAIGLLFCDVDKFKAVNDRLGHEIGDELLQQVAVRLRAATQPRDVLARFGGDEFVLLLHGVRSPADLTAAGRRVQASLAAPIAIRGERFHVSASVGAVLGRRNSSASEMLRNADAAMYAAKAQGSGRIVVFDDEASRHARDRLDLSAELDQALERDQLSVVYQPIVELKTGKIRSFEALLRWTHPMRGPVPPDVFIAMAEESGAIVPIGAWVLERACALLLEWRHQFPGAELTVGVNISAVQLEQSSRDLLGIIHGAGVAPRHVWLEVTERMDTSADIGDQVSRLRDNGVHFALDDFGMSYSSLTYLKRFPVEGIKIDRTFVAPMTEDETQRAIVQAILALGESLSIDVVAEGIETPEQLNALLDLGCRFGQGYLLTRPLTPDETFRALQAQASR
jgi:diguanylate cyclase (GGDEF)-like protein